MCSQRHQGLSGGEPLHGGSRPAVCTVRIPAGAFSAGLTGYGRSIGEVGEDIVTELSEVQTLSDAVNSTHFGLDVITSPIMILFCVILMAYAVLKVFFANLKRGGILLIQIAVGSLYMFSIPRGYLDGFVGWMKQGIGLCLTAFLFPYTTPLFYAKMMVVHTVPSL